MEKSFIELFAGIGGIGQALQKSGWVCRRANDICAHKAIMYNANYANGKRESDLTTADVRSLSPEWFTGVTLITACFPCQDFSHAGKKKGFDGLKSTVINDIFEKLELLGPLSPPIFMMENVPGLLQNKQAWQHLLRRLVALSYKFVDVRILNAKDFVPQSRRRVFIVACKKWNGACISPDRLISDGRSGRTDTLVEALRNVDKDVGVYWPDLNVSSIDSSKSVGLSKLLTDHLIAKDELIDVPYEMISPYHIAYLKSLARGTFRSYTMHGRGPGQQICHVKEGDVTPCLSGAKHYVRILTYADGASNDARLVSRKLRLRECARLQGFPDTYVIPSAISYTSAYTAFGEAVCVPVVEWLASNVINKLL